MTKRQWGLWRNRMRNRAITAIPCVIIWAAASLVIMTAQYLTTGELRNWGLSLIASAVLVFLISKLEREE